MRARRLILALVVVFILGCLGTATLTEFTSEEGGFSVSMPGTPKEETQTVPTDGGDIEVHMFSVESGGNGYVVGYSDYPADWVDVLDKEQLLDAARDGAVGDGTLLNEASITLDGNPGRELTIKTAEEEMTIFARFYLVGNRLHQVIISSKDETLTEDSKAFLDSFKLLD